MNNRFVFRIVRIWWEGFKVLCRWWAFGTVLTILSVPAMALADLAHNWAGYVVCIIFLLFIVPIVFYLTSRYLLLLGDNAPDVTHDNESASKADQHGQRVAHPIASWLIIVFPIVAAIITPPDVVSQITVAAEMMIVYGLAIFIISRFEWFKKASGKRKRAIAILVCLFSILVGCCTMFLPRILSPRPEQIPAADRSEKAVELT